MSVVGHIDESVRSRTYLLALTVVQEREIGKLERVIRQMHLPGQRRIHMHGERRSRASQILSAIVTSELVQVWVYIAPRPVLDARAWCLETALVDIAEVGMSRLVIERADERQDARDRAQIHRVVHKWHAPPRYLHAAAWEHAGLQGVGRGGMGLWRGW